LENIFPATPENIVKAAKLLHSGCVVAFPTETVYGLGVDAFCPTAVRKVYRIKSRSPRNPLIIHLADIDEIDRVADPTLKQREQLKKLENFWPGPLTVVLPKSKSLGPEVCAGLSTVAIRIPSHPVALSLLNTSKLAIAAPSANRSLYVSSTLAEHVYDDLGSEVDMILDGGKSEIGLESTILSLVGESPRILRPGSLSRIELEATLGEAIEVESATTLKPEAPGMMPVHYSPNTPLYFVSEDNHWPIDSNPSCRLGLISFSSATTVSNQVVAAETLSSEGNMEEVASGLYAALRKLDKLHLDMILIDSCKQEGIGIAVMNRLLRAVHPSEDKS